MFIGVRTFIVDGFDFVRLGKLQSDSVEKDFISYRQIKDETLLVGLREVKTSERMLACKSLLKRNIPF